MSAAPNLPDWLALAENPYLEGPFAPVFDECDAADLTVIGELPRGLDGVFLRNGPNPVHAPRGRYHWFDGDGMVHAVSFRDGRASYRNRWVRTEGLDAERRAGRALWPGYMERPDPAAPPGSGSDGWLKDTANTDLVFHNGAVLALWYQCGLPYRLDPRSLATLGAEDFRRQARAARLGARQGRCRHRRAALLRLRDAAARTSSTTWCPRAASCVRSTEIEVPGPRLPHDMAFTTRYSILMDLPLFWDPQLLERKIHRLGFHPELPSRFAVLPRAGGPVRWFEAEPAYIYHVVNSWEEGDTIVMDACRVVDPGARPPAEGGPLGRMLATLRLDARLHRYRFDLRTRPHARRAARRPEHRVPEHRRAPHGDADALRLHPAHREGHADAALRRARQVRHGCRAPRRRTPSAPAATAARLPSRRASEATRRTTASSSASCTTRSGGDSEAHVLDARDFTAEPLAIVELPRRVPVGFHACWVDGTQLPG